MEMLQAFSPIIEQVSVDEAFLDMSGTEKLFGDPLAAARQISRMICDGRGLTASVGIAPNKFLARSSPTSTNPAVLRWRLSKAKRLKSGLHP